MSRRATVWLNVFCFIMVDEYQDTNHLQAKIIRLLAATHDNVAVVGDDRKASIRFAAPTFATSWISETISRRAHLSWRKTTAALSRF